MGFEKQGENISLPEIAVEIKQMAEMDQAIRKHGEEDVARTPKMRHQPKRFLLT